MGEGFVGGKGNSLVSPQDTYKAFLKSPINSDSLLTFSNKQIFRYTKSDR